MASLDGGIWMVVLCLVGLLVLGGLGAVAIVLLKLGVVGSYWLKGDESDAGTADYRLDHSRGA